MADTWNVEVWTIASVKRELPNVTVKIGKKTAIGRISGRLNQFATVTVDAGFRIGCNDPWKDWHFAWQTIADALNSGKPLIAE